MFGIHLGQTHEKIIAVADVGSGSSALAIIAVPKKGAVRILAAERRQLKVEERSREATLAATCSNLVEVGQGVLALYAKTGGAAPSAVYAIVNTPWTHSKTIHADSVFPEMTRITPKMISALAQKALASDTEFDKSRILQASLIRVEVNGYPTDAPEGKSGTSLSAVALLSDCDPSVRSGVTSALQQLFGGQSIRMRSGVQAILSALHARMETPQDFLIVDMSSEGTDLIVVRSGITTDHATVAEGKNSLIKRISGAGMPEDTMTTLRLASRGESHDPAAEAINTAMATVEPEMVRVFGEAITKLIARERLPNQLILAAHDDLIPWLSSFFARIDFAQFTLTTQPFSVRALKPADLEHWALPEAGVHVDVGILVAASLVNTEERRG